MTWFDWLLGTLACGGWAALYVGWAGLAVVLAVTTLSWAMCRNLTS